MRRKGGYRGIKGMGGLRDIGELREGDGKWKMNGRKGY